MTAIIFDTETTGLDAPEVIEAAWMYVDPTGGILDIGQTLRFAPSKPISLGALATHHIMDEDLVGCPPSTTCALPAGVEYLIGYNVDFDWRAIGEPAVKRIDVLALCRALWPDVDSHSQGAMLYLLERALARDMLRDAHSARTDIEACRVILMHVLHRLGRPATFEALWQHSERARIPTRMPFGKWKGRPIAEIPADYKRWLLGQPDVDCYLAQALRSA